MIVRFLNTDQSQLVTLSNVRFSGFNWTPPPSYQKLADVYWYDDETGELLEVDPGIPVSSSSFVINIPTFTTHQVAVIKVNRTWIP